MGREFERREAADENLLVAYDFVLSFVGSLRC